ncbi:MAG: CAP domain-containing protein [Pseudomonadota bacterium]
MIKQSFLSLKLVLFLVICLFSSPITSLGQSLYNNPQEQDSLQLNAIEKEISTWLLKVRKLNAQTPFYLDKRIVNATRNINKSINSSNPSLDRDLIQTELLINGISEAKYFPHAIVSSSSSLKSFLIKTKVSLAKALSKKIKESKFDTFGMGISSINDEYIGTIVILKRFVELSPIPKEIKEAKPIKISGKLFSQVKNPKIYTTTPSGKVNQYPLNVSGNNFSGELILNEKSGRYKMELMVTTQFGPTVANLFPIFVDIPYSAENERDKKMMPNEPEIYNSIEEAENKFFQLVNDIRKKMNLNPLIFNEELRNMARLHSEDMARNNFFGHVSRNGSTLEQRSRGLSFLYVKVTENLAKNESIFEAVHKLMESPAHRGNIMDPDLSDAGAGIFVKKENGKRVYVITQNFAQRTDELGFDLLNNSILERISSINSAIKEDALISKICKIHTKLMIEEDKVDTNLNYGNLFQKVKVAKYGIRSVWGQVYKVNDISFLDSFIPPKTEWKYYGVGITEGSKKSQYWVTVVLVK